MLYSNTKNARAKSVRKAYYIEDSDLFRLFSLMKLIIQLQVPSLTSYSVIDCQYCFLYNYNKGCNNNTVKSYQTRLQN